MPPPGPITATPPPPRPKAPVRDLWGLFMFMFRGLLLYIVIVIFHTYWCIKSLADLLLPRHHTIILTPIFISQPLAISPNHTLTRNITKHHETSRNITKWLTQGPSYLDRNEESKTNKAGARASLHEGMAAAPNGWGNMLGGLDRGTSNLNRSSRLQDLPWPIHAITMLAY